MEEREREGKRLQQTDRSRKKRRRRRRWPGVLIGLLLVALVATGVALLPTLLGQETPETPTAANASQTQADNSGETEQSGEPTEPEDSTEPDETEAPDQTGEPEQTEEPEETAATLEEQAQALLDGMTLREKVLQMFIVTPEQLTGVSTVTQAGETTRAALEEWPVGGIIYFAANLQTSDQVRQMLSNVQEMTTIGLFLAVDEEGGTVARMGNNSAMGMTQFPDMGEIETTDEAYNVGLTIGSELAEYGFNLDFAPVADVNSNPNNPVIGTRSFSSDAETAAELVAACVSGFEDSGMLCTLKHFPGHGDTATDSHYGAAVSDKTLAELEECELIPFQAGIDAGADFVMVGHISVPAVTGDQTPASLSYEITTGLLREELGFEGIIVTDSMSMQAITDTYSSSTAAVMAIQAGVDIVLMPASLSGAVEGVLSAVEAGTITESRIDESVLRILSVKLERGILDAE